jgi:hypothetical protein
VIEAKTMQNKAGRILLMGDMRLRHGQCRRHAGCLGPDGGDGGFIETSAAHVKVADGRPRHHPAAGLGGRPAPG